MCGMLVLADFLAVPQPSFFRRLARRACQAERDGRMTHGPGRTPCSPSFFVASAPTCHHASRGDYVCVAACDRAK